MRDLEGYKETRLQLFHLRPTHKASWIGFAMSYHLLKDYDMALKILEEFRKTQKKTSYDYEYSELLMYQNMVIRESGDIAGALEHFDKHEKFICDKINMKETRGRYLLVLSRKEDAGAVYQDLLSRNPENHEYYRQLEAARSLATETERLGLYEEYQSKFPRATAPKRLPLNFLTGDNFDTQLYKYVTSALRKGVPPLFVDLKPLYNDADKKKQLETLFARLLNNLTEKSSFDDEGKVKESPTCLLWTYYYLSQQYDSNGDYTKALELINKAIDHTPTLIELFMLKGKIYKHAGDPEKAVECLDEAQSMDTADRYINCKCAKYMLRANKIKDAEAMCALFTREGVPAMENLDEMQCMWFQTECARAYKRLGEQGETMKKCYEIDRHFTEIVEDQFDFHTYCMRKMTLKAYVTLLRLEDEVRSHRFYHQAAAIAIQTLVDLYDNPIKDVDPDEELKKNSKDLDPEELKKLLAKARKARKKKEEEEKAKQEEEKKRKEAQSRNRRKKDEDCENQLKEELIPNKLARTEDPLGEATKFLEPLLLLVNNSITTHFLAFEVYLRKDKPLLMLKALRQAITLNSTTGQHKTELHSCMARFLNYIDTNKATINPTTMKVIQSIMPEDIKNTTAANYNEKFIGENSGDLERVFVSLNIQVKIDGSSADQAVDKLTQTPLAGQKYNVCKTVLDAFHKGDFGPAGKDQVDSFKKKCREQFPLARCFMEEQELQKEEEEKAAAAAAAGKTGDSLSADMDGLALNDKPKQ